MIASRLVKEGVDERDDHNKYDNRGETPVPARLVRGCCPVR